MTQLTKEQIAILKHTLTRAAGGLYCGDSPDMQALISRRLMEPVGRKAFVPHEYFRLTDAGKKLVDEIA